jgi:hypothetical protein
MATGRYLTVVAAICCGALPAFAQTDTKCVAVKFDEGGTLPIATSAIVQYQALLEWPGPQRIFAVDIVRPQSSELPPGCAIDALRLAPVGQGPTPECTLLSNGKRSCTYRINSSRFGAKVVMQARCDIDAVRHAITTHIDRNALGPCHQAGGQSERSNSALVSDAYATALPRLLQRVTTRTLGGNETSSVDRSRLCSHSNRFLCWRILVSPYASDRAS